MKKTYSQIAREYFENIFAGARFEGEEKKREKKKKTSIQSVLLKYPAF